MSTPAQKTGSIGGASGTEGTPPNPPPATGTPPTGGAPGGSGTGGGSPTFEFTFGDKKFNTPEELNAYLRTLTATVREQGRALNAAAGSQGFTPTGRPADAPQTPPTGAPAGASNSDFWNDPVGTLRTEMAKIIEPFQRDLAQSQRVTARQQLMGEYPDYVDLEQMVVASLAQTGAPQTYENLRGAYYMVKGYLAATGQAAAPATTPATPATPDGGNGSPPQHRPSAAPLPAGGQPAGKKRELTENERQLARISGYTDEQYLAWLEVNPEDVVTSKIGKE